MLKSFGVLCLMILFTGCSYDSVEELSGAVCKVENVSFSQDIVPILNNNCIACHSAFALQGDVNLEGHSEILKYALNGALLGSISYESGYIAMPSGASKLSDCNISQVAAWINAGSPNN